MIPMIKLQVSFSSKSPVFLTPMILLAEEPPNWLVKPPPFAFCARITSTSNTAKKMIRLMIKVYISLLLQFFNLVCKVSFFLWILPNQLFQHFDRAFLFPLFDQDLNNRFRNDILSKFT